MKKLFRRIKKDVIKEGDECNINSENKEAIIEMVKKAGDLIMCHWDCENIIAEKGSFDYVTELDVAVQNFLIDNLKKIDKTYEFIAEENDIDAKKFDNVWIIDPIDGTTNYIHRYPHFAICLAYFNKGRAVFSIIYNPASKELYMAEKGKGAFLNEKRIYVSDRKELGQSMIGFDYPKDRTRASAVFGMTHEVYMKCQDAKRKGSAALDFADVACGRIEAYYRMDLAIWDVAPGALLVEEAGGIIEAWSKNIDSNTTMNGVTASNGKINEELNAVMKLKSTTKY